MASDTSSPPFIRFGPAVSEVPVVVAVPHAGRTYPAVLLNASRLDRESLETLEDRYADLLVPEAVSAGATVFVATAARAWIDLNRDPREIDPAMVAPPPQHVIASPKVRGGLGLIPRRIAGAGDINPRPLHAGDVAGRIASVHRPWHEALATSLDAACERFGVAILLDLHSMPPLAGWQPPQLVIGDRHGRSAAPRFVAAAVRQGKAAGFRVAQNDPYAGGYGLERHGRPADGRHAIQVELCRSLYLDAHRRAPGTSLAAARAFVGRLVSALAAEAVPTHIAAE